MTENIFIANGKSILCFTYYNFQSAKSNVRYFITFQSFLAQSTRSFIRSHIGVICYKTPTSFDGCSAEMMKRSLDNIFEEITTHFEGFIEIPYIDIEQNQALLNQKLFTVVPAAYDLNCYRDRNNYNMQKFPFFIDQTA